MESLRLTILQTNLIWQNSGLNLQQFAAKLANLKGGTDLVILPEMFTTGFSMDTSLAEEPGGETEIWMKEQSRNLNAAIIGSIIVRVGDKYYNRLLFVAPDGSVQHYDKRHLFTYGHEDKHYSAGRKRLVVEYKGWKICPLICYDLRFPVWSRNNEDYDLLVYVANWPSVRTFAWSSLLIARAIENQCYVAGVNRTGIDGNGLEYCGASVCLDYLGNEIISCADHVGTFTTELSKQDLQKYRHDFPALADQDKFILN